MKTLTLAGLMTLSAIAGSAITLLFSQASFAQDNQNDDRHWTQQQAAQTAQNANRQQYTEYKIIRLKGQKRSQGFENMMTNALRDGWVPLGNFHAACNAFDCNYSQAVMR